MTRKVRDEGEWENARCVAYLSCLTPAGASALLRQVNQALAARLSEAAVGELDARDDGSFGIRRADPPSRLRRIIGNLWDVR